jgi:hypothetical protein
MWWPQVFCDDAMILEIESNSKYKKYKESVQRDC